MSYQLLLLGLLAEQPRHGYEIKQHFEEGTFAEYVKVSGGGLYYNLHKLVKDGYVAEQTIEREGSYPERYIYEITEEGKKQLYRLVGETLGDIKGRKFFDPLDAALLFGTVLPKDAVLIRLQRHLDRMKAKLVEVELIYDSLSTIHGKLVNEPYMLLLLDHSISRLKSDMDWFKKAQQKIKDDESFGIVHREKQPVSALIQSNSQVDAMEDSENFRLWQSYDAQNEKLFGRYNQQIEQAWREYEISEKLFINSKKQLEAAQLEYDRKVQTAWEKYQGEVAVLRGKIDALINKALPAVPAS